MNQHVFARPPYPLAPTKPLPTPLPDDGRPDDDLYETPEYAVRALLTKETFPGAIWEPAAGMGKLARVLQAHGADDLFTSDLNHYTGADHLNAYGDFTQMGRGGRRVNHIITNPPFLMAESFARHALSLADTKVALLLPLQFLESMTRIPFFDEHEPARIWIFRRRLKMKPYGQADKGSPKIGTAWYVWDQSHRGRPQVDWLYDTDVLPPDTIASSHDLTRTVRQDEVQRELAAKIKRENAKRKGEKEVVRAAKPELHRKAHAAK